MLNQQQFSEYDERPDPKGPGQQGVLFRNVAPAMGESRYPKGYTPERRNAVLGAMPPAYGPTEGTTVNPGHEKDRIVQAISRSSMPVEHLQGLNSITTGVRGAGDEGGSYDFGGGIKLSGTFNKSYGTPDAKQFNDRYQQRVLLHEIGHHATPDVSRQNPGLSEAVAENYADTHYNSPGAYHPSSSYDVAMRENKTLKKQWGPGTVKQYKETRQAGTQPEILQPLQFNQPEASSKYNQFGFPI